MAVTTNTYFVENGNNQVHTISADSVDNNKLFFHIILRDLDSSIKIKFFQGSEANLIDGNTHQIINDDIMCELTNCNGLPIEVTLNNGNYFLAIDTFYGKWGEARINNLTSTTGKIKIIATTPSKKL